MKSNHFAQRFEVAHLLRLKKTYETIKKETGASTATISRVRRAFDYGNDTYDEMLGRLYPDENSTFSRVDQANIIFKIV